MKRATIARIFYQAAQGAAKVLTASVASIEPPKKLKHKPGEPIKQVYA